MRYLTLLILSLILSGNACAFVQFRFVTEELPPLQFLEKDNTVSGATVEIVQELIKRTKIDASIEVYPWARSYSLAVKDPHTFIFSIRRSEIREPLFNWLGTLYPIKTYFTSLKNGKKISILGPDDMKTYRIGVVRGDFIEQQIQQWGLSEQVYMAAEHKKLWGLLFAGKIDAVVSNGFSVRQEFSRLGYNVEDIQLNSSPLFEDKNLFLAANIKMDKEILARVRNSLIEIKKDGTYDRILARYNLSY